MSAEQTTLHQLSDHLADAVASGATSIVAVHARSRLPSTGIHWRDGLIVTTEGTVKREQGITVTLPNGKSAPATLVGRDRGTDLAVLRVATGLAPVATIADPVDLKPGHLVLALARLDDGGPRVAFGAVSATGGAWRCWKGGEIDRWLQSDLTLYPGFGGGPLIDAAGRTRGINSGALSRPFATTIPTTTVERVLAHVVDRGYVPRGWLGAAMQPIRFDSAAAKRHGFGAGLVVLSLEPDGPALVGGVMIGDVIVRAQGRPVDHPEQMLSVLSGDVVGKALKLDLVRAGAVIPLEILIGERPRDRG